MYKFKYLSPSLSLSLHRLLKEFSRDTTKGEYVCMYIYTIRICARVNLNIVYLFLCLLAFSCFSMQCIHI